MYVSIINGETSNHMIHEKEAAKCEGIFGTANSAVILVTLEAGGFEPPSRDASRQASTCLVA